VPSRGGEWENTRKRGSNKGGNPVTMPDRDDNQEKSKTKVGGPPRETTCERKILFPRYVKDARCRAQGRKTKKKDGEERRESTT